MKLATFLTMCIVMVCLLQTVTATKFYGNGYLGGNYNFGNGHGYGYNGFGNYYGYPNYYRYPNYYGYPNQYSNLGYYGYNRGNGLGPFITLLAFRNIFGKIHFRIHLKAECSSCSFLAISE